MNPANFLRFISRSKVFYGNQLKHARFTSELATTTRSMSAGLSSQWMKEKEQFHDALPGIIENLMNSPRISQLPNVAAWIKTVTEHSVSGSKHLRGIMAILAYEMFEKPENITEENIKLAKVLGWCLEMGHGYLCIFDDIMDDSTTRRGRPCWHLLPNVGMGAVNDAILLANCMNETIDIYFLNTKHFIPVTRLFNEGVLFTAMGQYYDFITAKQKKSNYSWLNRELYDDICKYKTSFFAFRLPVFLGLTLVKDVDSKIYPAVDDLSLKLGMLYQMQDDFIDCFGDETLTGKAGTDIQEGKCTWLAATALEHCNSEQRDLFTRYYASKDPEHVAIIKKLYKDLDVPNLYKIRETELHDDIVRGAHALPSDTAPNFYFKLLDIIYKRNH